jgi:hypothetical protein
MKMLRIDDTQYNQLQLMADANNTPVTKCLKSILDGVLNPQKVMPSHKFASIGTPSATPKIIFTSPLPDPLDTKVRDFRAVLTDITNTEKERDEKIAYCQDKDATYEIQTEYKARIQDLWTEYTILKEQNAQVSA